MSEADHVGEFTDLDVTIEPLLPRSMIRLVTDRRSGKGVMIWVLLDSNVQERAEEPLIGISMQYKEAHLLNHSWAVFKEMMVRKPISLLMSKGVTIRYAEHADLTLTLGEILVKTALQKSLGGEHLAVLERLSSGIPTGTNGLTLITLALSHIT
jgi:hypothetical protein